MQPDAVQRLDPAGRSQMVFFDRAWACLRCNKRKADRTPDQAGMRLARTPRRPHWRPLYALPEVRIASWSRFISEAYWNVELEA